MNNPPGQGIFATLPCDPYNPNKLPMGSRLRLKASFDESPYSGKILVVFKALKKYGMLLTDFSSTTGQIQAAKDPCWAQYQWPDMYQYRTLLPIHFDVVDTRADVGEAVTHW